jgi:hypothetical protein
VFLVNSRNPLFCATCHRLPDGRSSFSRSYRCILPSSFSIVLSSALVFSTCPPVSVSGTVYMLELFPGSNSLHDQSNKTIQFTYSVTSNRFRNINLISIDYAFQPRLRGRLTLRRLTLRRKPWTFGESVSHTFYRYSCQHSHFRYLQQTSRFTFTGLRNAPLPLAPMRKSASSVYGLSPVTLLAQENLIRLVSYYAFFKWWLLLSQHPSCFGLLTSFHT